MSRIRNARTTVSRSYPCHRLKDCEPRPLAAVVAALLLGASAPLTAYAGVQTVAHKAGPSNASTRKMARRRATGADAAVNAGQATTVKQLSTINVMATAQGHNPTIGPLSATPPRDIPQSVTVVDRQLMQEQGATSFEQALRYVPGITFAAAEGGAIGNNINLRGFNARTDVYLDGFRDRGQYYRDTFSLDAIEVLKGPSSMLFGRGSTGGIVNQVGKVPSWTPHDVVQASVGTDNQYRLTGDFDHAVNDTVAFRLPVMAQSVHSNRDVLHKRDYGVAPSLRIRPNRRTEITLTSLFEHNHDMADYGLPPLNGEPAPVSRDNFYGLTSDHTVQDVQMVGARIRYRATPQLVLRNQVGYVHYRIDAIESAAGNIGTLDPSGNFDKLPTKAIGNITDLPLAQLFVQLSGSDARRIRDTSAYDQFDATWQFSTGSLDHKLVAGGELGHDTYRNQDLTVNNLSNLTLSLLDPQHISSAEAGIGYSPRNLAHANANTYAAYVNDTVSIGEYWKVVAGLRRDHFAARLTDTNDTRGPADASQTVGHNSVRAGLLYQPTADQTYYVSYGTSFDPALETLSVPHGQQNLPSPATSRSLEAGTKFQFFDGGLSLNTAVFHIHQSNTAVQVEPGIYEPQGSVRVKGAEFSITGRITPKWQVFGGYTYLDGRIVDSPSLEGTEGNVPMNMPRNNATLWTGYAVAPHWSVGGGTVWQSRRFANTTNVVSVPSFVRFDATIAYTQPKYDVRLNLFNLTDVRYFTNLIQSDGGRAVPGPGRSALVTMTWHFD